MSISNTRNRTGLILATLLLSSAAISCTLVRELAGGSESEKTRRLNEKVPAGSTRAYRDYDLHKPESFRIILPGSGQILIGDADAPPIDIASLDQHLKTLYTSKTPDRRVVFLIAAADVPITDIASVLDKVRENDINIVKLVTSSRSPDKDGGVFNRPPPPDRTIEVRVRKEVVSERPNPLTLLVTTTADGTPLLNNESSGGLDSLTERLGEIFKQREANGVFRENTNEVEKTVLIDLAPGVPNRKYGDIVKVVDAAKLGGADPIVLGNKEDLARIPSFPDLEPLRRPTVIDPNDKVVPKVISGGVLNGKATNLPKPPYPAAARAVRATGTVIVQVTIDTDGRVIQATAVSGHPLLRAAAVTAARTATFAPTLLSGKPVKVTGVLTYNFVVPE